jgi:autoinducer 2-degrading protein
VYTVLGIIKVKPQHLDEFLENIRDHAANSLREPGCVRYDVLQDQNDPMTICLYEVFQSETDLEFHHAQDYYKKWMAMSRDWRDASSYTRRVLRNVFPED